MLRRLSFDLNCRRRWEPFALRNVFHALQPAPPPCSLELRWLTPRSTRSGFFHSTEAAVYLHVSELNARMLVQFKDTGEWVRQGE